MRAASHSKKKKVTITRRQINTGFIVAVLSTCWLSPNSLSSEGPDGRVQGACPMLLRPAMPAWRGEGVEEEEREGAARIVPGRRGEGARKRGGENR